MAMAQPRAQPAKSAAPPAVINILNTQPVHLVLAKDLSRSLRSGHPWLFAGALEKLPSAPPGSIALVKNKSGDIIAKGIYDPSSPIPFRSMAVLKERLDLSLVTHRVTRALTLRQRLFPNPQVTNGYRLFNGEGDGLPGLVCDVYADVAVLKLDGTGPQGFYNPRGIAMWLTEELPHLRTVYLKNKSGSEQRGQVVWGRPVDAPVVFRENGASFKVDVVMGQKTGFFLDQRANRATVERLCHSQGQGHISGLGSAKLRMLNVFGYTGGFSIFAGRGGAGHVTTVDLAPAAIDFAQQNWQLNDLSPSAHTATVSDAFVFLEAAGKSRETWDVVVVDPPSFAPNQQSVEKAKASYERIFSLAARVVAPDGVIAMASCSSHITAQMFEQICSNALTQARRRGYCVTMAGQPEDHPFPMAAPELRYLKFNVYQLEG